MDIEQSGAPVGEAVSLSLAKLHCVSVDDDDTLVQHYLDSAISYVERACNTVLLTTEFTATGDDFCLSFGGYPNPVIDSVTYLDELGAPGQVTEYEIKDNALHIEDAPEVSEATVVFTAGKGAGNIEPDLVQAILMLTASWYQTREAVGKSDLAAVPFGVRSLMATHRSFAY